jgi:signal transduction histidine kinase
MSASSLGGGVTARPTSWRGSTPALLERVLHDLAGNASRYRNQGGTIGVAARRWNDDNSVELAVTDSGPLSADDIRSQRFVEYVRGNGGKREMGLYFCRLVAEAHGGRSIGPRLNVRRPERA